MHGFVVLLFLAALASCHATEPEQWDVAEEEMGYMESRDIPSSHRKLHMPRNLEEVIDGEYIVVYNDNVNVESMATDVNNADLVATFKCNNGAAFADVSSGALQSFLDDPHVKYVVPVRD